MFKASASVNRVIMEEPGSHKLSGTENRLEGRYQTVEV
jgi:hypothetical protein